MKKISTLFFVEYHKKGTPGVIHNLVRDENSWVFSDKGVKATRKFDGTACLLQDGVLYKRYDAKQGKVAPAGSIPCQEKPDPISGHHPHWAPLTQHDKYFVEGLLNSSPTENGTYELCGPKVGNNAEKFNKHLLVKHGCEVIDLPNFDFNTIRDFLSSTDVEGIVFHGPKGKLCKIRKTDFGFTR